MTTINITAKTIDEVIPDASLDGRMTNMIITSCWKCGGIVFYQVIEHHYEGSDYATDRCLYCVQCGHLHSGFTDDPFDELALDTDDTTDRYGTDTINAPLNDSAETEIHCPWCDSTRIRIVYTDDDCTDVKLYDCTVCSFTWVNEK